MTSEATRQLIEQFFLGLTAGKVPDELLDPELRFWSISSGREVDKTGFAQGIAILGIVGQHAIKYDLLSITSEDDRVAVQVKSSGTLMNGDQLANNQVFLFKLRDGKIVHVSEFNDPRVVAEKVAPLMQEVIAQMQQKS